MKRKIYIASSWKNAVIVRNLAKVFRASGHKAFDFTDPADHTAPGVEKYVFDGRAFAQYRGQNPLTVDWLDFLTWKPTKLAFRSDKAGLDWADTVVLLIPSGRSSHLEAGYGVGKGKSLFIYGNLPPGEFDAMYKFASGCFRENQLDLLLSILESAL
jgi:hypothetical protein